MGIISKFFDRPLHPGDPVSRRGLVKALNAMDKAWATLDVSGGYVDWSPDGRPLIVAGAGSANRLRPFRVTRATTDGEVTVADGTWEHTESSVGGGRDVTIRRYSLGGDQTITSGHYILLCLTRGEYDPDGWTLSVWAQSSLPSGGGSNLWWKLLAVDNSDTPGTDPAEVEEKWFGGNLHTVIDSPDDGRSITKRDGTFDREIKGWSDDESESVAAEDDVLVRRQVFCGDIGEGEAGWYEPQMKYVSIADLLTYIGDGGSWGGTLPWMEEGVIDHHALTGLTSYDDHHGSRDAVAGGTGVNVYIHPDGNEARNAMAGKIGDTSGAKSIDPNGRQGYADDGATVSLDWGAQQSAVAIPTSAQAELTDSTGGTPGSTLAAVTDTSASDQSGPINDNVASLAAELESARQDILNLQGTVEELRDALCAYKILATS